MFVVVSGADVVIDKEEVPSGFKEYEQINGFNIAVMLLINISVMPCPIIICGSMVTCETLIFKKVLTAVISCFVFALVNSFVNGGGC